MSLFGWWKPKCPVSFREEGWVETRMRWLGRQFGVNRLTRCRVVLPEELDFLETFDETPEAAQRLLTQVCQYMEVHPSEVRLAVEPHDAMPGKVGYYASGVIHIDETQLAHPVGLTSTLAHELAHHILIERRLLDGDADMEWTTDLLPLLFGLGIFAANATVHETHEHAGHASRWSVIRQGYLPSRMLGYAMALHAWLCGEQSPDWVGSLRLDAADAFNKGLAYLRATQDSLLRPDNLRNDDSQTSIRQWIEAVEQGPPHASVAALWQLAARADEAGDAVPAVTRRLTDRRPGLRAEAARTLAQLGPAAETAVPALLEALNDREVEVRASAAYALGRLHREPDLVVMELTERLDDTDAIETLAWALAQFGALASPAMPRLLAALKTAIGRGDSSLDYLVYAVRSISASPEEEIRELIASCDDDLQRQVDGVLPGADEMIPTPPGGQPWWFWTGGAA